MRLGLLNCMITIAALRLFVVMVGVVCYVGFCALGGLWIWWFG